jgi:hypothetical protein
MKSSLNSFRTEFSQTVLNFLWSAWSQVGVMGGSAPSRPRIVDPEPLLLLTWECARQDARAFDEVLDWLVQNGRWINLVRLSSLLEEDQVCSPTIAGAVAAFLTERDKTPKWRKLAERCRPKSKAAPGVLFQRRGKPLLPTEGETDEIFSRYGWQRSPIQLRGQSQRLPAWSPASLVLKCRAFFGVSIRADVFAYLVARGPATASGLARELGYSQRRVQDTLLEMQLADQFQTRFEGNRREFSVESSRGWQLLFEATSERAAWFNWRAYGRGISVVWNKVFAMKEEGLTAYLLESEMAKALESARPDFTAAGLALSGRPTTTEFLEKLRVGVKP